MMQLETGEELAPINLSTVEMKHMGAKWLVKMFEHISDNSHLMVNGFVSPGIIYSVSDAIKAGVNDDPRSDDSNVDAVFSSFDEND